MFFQINPHSGVPVYRQIIDQVKFFVSGGSIKPGDKLPSIRELARNLSVNPTTVAKAYERMASEGIIEKQAGKGAFICDWQEQMNASTREQKLRDLARQMAVEMKQMGMSMGTILKVLGEEIDRLEGDINE